MLSRAMLYAERWDDARIAAEEVMGMGYKLEEKENYSNAFKAGSQEAILQSQRWQPIHFGGRKFC